MNLREAGISEKCSTFVGAPTSGDVRAFGVGGQIINVAISSAGEDYRIREMHAEFARNQIAGDDAARLPVDDDEIEHFRSGDHGDGAGENLAFECLVRA